MAGSTRDENFSDFSKPPSFQVTLGTFMFYAPVLKIAAHGAHVRMTKELVD